MRVLFAARRFAHPAMGLAVAAACLVVAAPYPLGVRAMNIGLSPNGHEVALNLDSLHLPSSRSPLPLDTRTLSARLIDRPWTIDLSALRAAISGEG